MKVDQKGCVRVLLPWCAKGRCSACVSGLSCRFLPLIPEYDLKLISSSLLGFISCGISMKSKTFSDTLMSLKQFYLCEQEVRVQGLCRLVSGTDGYLWYWPE